MWEMQNGGFNPKQAGGLVIEEPMLNDLYGRPIRLLKLPRATEKTLKAPHEERPSSVLHHRYPTSWVCSGEVGHIEGQADWIESDDGSKKKIPFCSRAGCNNKTHSGRFISVCQHGHVTDFDYHRWVHAGKKGCGYADSKLEIQYGRNAAFTLDDWVVSKCTTCEAIRSMKDVPWIRADEERAWQCDGKRPWIQMFGNDANEKCDEGMVHFQVGNTAVTYPKRTQVLLIPPRVGWEVGIDGSMLSEGVGRTSEGPSLGIATDYLKRDLENTGFDTLDELKQRIEEYWVHEESPLTFETYGLENA